MSKLIIRPLPSARPTSKNDPSSRTTRSGLAAARPGRVGRFRSRHPLVAALTPVIVVVAAIATLVAVKVADTPGTSGTPGASPGSIPTASGGAGAAVAESGTTPLPQSVVSALSVAPSTLDAVGTPGSVTAPNRLAGSSVARGTDGKPVVTYIGAEYCPYCAAERWAIAVALSRFGTFSNLAGTHSSSSDVYPDTQTLSFYGSTYTSADLDFRAVEETTNQRSGAGYQPLESPTSGERALMASEDPLGSIPFLDIAGTYVVTGASFSPQVLAGLSRNQIAAQLGDPSSVVAQDIDGTANYLTAAISRVTQTQPASVADPPVIAAIAKGLGA